MFHHRSCGYGLVSVWHFGPVSSFHLKTIDNLGHEQTLGHVANGPSRADSRTTKEFPAQEKEEEVAARRNGWI